MQWLTIDNGTKKGSKWLRKIERDDKMLQRRAPHIPREEERSSSFYFISHLSFYSPACHYSPGTRREQHGDCAYFPACFCVCHVLCILHIYVGRNVFLQHWKAMLDSFSRPREEARHSENIHTHRRNSALFTDTITHKVLFCTAQFIK